MDDKKESIIAKIMKLMELGNEEKNSNPHEREAATKMAAKLMADYSIDFIDLKTNKAKDDPFITLDVEGSSEIKVDYEAALAHAIAKAFDCKMINSYKYDYNADEIYGKIWKICFLGSKNDIDIVVYFFKFLRRTLGAMARRNVTKESIQKADPYAARRITEAYIQQARKNYCFGMVSTIDQRLQELYLKREEFIPANCKDLMVVKKDDLEKYMKEKFPNLRYSKGTTLKGDMNSYHKGKQDGHSVNLSRPIDNNFTSHAQIG